MNRLGYIRHGEDVYTYQIGSRSLLNDTPEDDSRFLYGAHTLLLGVGGYFIAPFGENNLEPNICARMIGDNRLLPELIEKQIRMLYGNGPVLYIQSIDSEGKVIRRYLSDTDIEKWLDSWAERGLQDDFPTYINKCVRSFYYSEGIFSKWRLSAASALAPRRGLLPVAGLEHISELRCRLCTDHNPSGKTDWVDSDFKYVMVGNWAGGNIGEYKVFRRMNHAKPLSDTSVISYSKNPTFGEEVYAYNVFFRGIKKWIHGSNLTPAYINDYLENALSARLHIIIPEAWIAAKKSVIEDLCRENAELKANNKEMMRLRLSNDEYMDVGDIYKDDLMTEYINKELNKLTRFLSGSGRNQGKVYASRAYYNDNGEPNEWKIQEIPQKYKEFIEALLDYDKRADEVMLSSKGLDSSISNVSKDGIVSKSGSDAYYNYMIYLNGLTIPETVICKDVNFALKLNFPDKYAAGIRIGFYRPTIARQQDVTPENRMSNQENL